MPPLLERVIGIALIVGAALGLLFNIAGLVMVPRLSATVRDGAVTTLNTLDNTLATTAEGLVVVDSSLDNATETVDALAATTRGVAQTVEDTTPLFDTIIDLSGEALPTTIATTQLSLLGAAEGMQTIEAVLGTLNAVPLLGLPAYNPPVSLYDSLVGVSTSLEPLATSFTDIESDMTTARANLETVNQEITTLANTLDQVDTTIEEARTVTGQYAEVIDQQRAVVNNLQGSLDTGITWAGFAASMLLVWLAIAQVGLLSQGFEMVARSGRKRGSPIE